MKYLSEADYREAERILSVPPTEITDLLSFVMAAEDDLPWPSTRDGRILMPAYAPPGREAEHSVALRAAAARAAQEIEARRKQENVDGR